MIELVTSYVTNFVAKSLKLLLISTCVLLCNDVATYCVLNV